MSDNSLADTTLMVDNTTFAAAGRTAYFGDLSTKGGRHAEEYYSLHPKQQNEDQVAFQEFLSALVLFDHLVWDSGSLVQEASEMTPPAIGSAWVYDWFPMFERLRQEHFTIAHYSHTQVGEPEDRLMAAVSYTMQWAAVQGARMRSLLPTTFRIPDVYRSPRYRDRNFFVDANRIFGLGDFELALAMFAHRGIFYYSRCYDHGDWSYLPHSYRASLLLDPSIHLLAMLCATGDTLGPEGIDATEVFLRLDNKLIETVRKVVSLPMIPARAGIGRAFLIGTKEKGQVDPLRALETVVDFRNSSPGEKLRRQFRELVRESARGHSIVLEDGIKQFEKSLHDEVTRTYGIRLADYQSGTDLVKLSPLRDVVAAIINHVPRSWQRAMNRLLHWNSSRTGFQIIFRYYVDANDGHME